MTLTFGLFWLWLCSFGIDEQLKFIEQGAYDEFTENIPLTCVAIFIFLINLAFPIIFSFLLIKHILKG